MYGWPIIGCLIEHWDLIFQLVRRAIASRYRGSILGVAWSLVVPLLMLFVYTFVFGVVFKVRWAHLQQSNLDFASVLFSGLILHAMLAECLSRAPGLITGNVQYVKKVVFPLEILAWVSVLTALFQGLISLGVLLVYLIVVKAQFSWTIVFIPVVILPLVFMALAISWLLSSFAVYVRDIGQIIGILTTILLFISPIFYPMDALPEAIRPFIYLNPLSLIVEQIRSVIIWGEPPNLKLLAAYMSIALMLAYIGFRFFRLLRPGFADVV